MFSIEIFQDSTLNLVAKHDRRGIVYDTGVGMSPVPPISSVTHGWPMDLAMGLTGNYPWVYMMIPNPPLNMMINWINLLLFGIIWNNEKMSCTMFRAIFVNLNEQIQVQHVGQWIWADGNLGNLDFLFQIYQYWNRWKKKVGTKSVTNKVFSQTPEEIVQRPSYERYL